MSSIINQKGVAHILVVVLLLVGVVVGLYLIRNPQIFKPRAAGISEPISGPIEYSSYPVYNTYPGPIAFYSFDEAGTLGITRVGTGKYWSAGKIGTNAGFFNGTDDYWNCSDAVCGGSTKLDIGTNKITVEAWVKPDVLRHAGIVSKYSTGVGAGIPRRSYMLNIQNEKGNIMFSVVTNHELNMKTVATNNTISAGIWSHVAGVYDGTTIKVYINGILDSATTPQSGTIVDSAADFRIGAYYDSANSYNYFPGQIDEVRVYNYALTQSQIQSDLNPPLIGGPVSSPSSTSTSSPSAYPTYTPSPAPSATSIDQRISNLESQLAASQAKQAETQSQLDKLINWLKSVLPGFN